MHVLCIAQVRLQLRFVQVWRNEPENHGACTNVVCPRTALVPLRVSASSLDYSFLQLQGLAEKVDNVS